MRSSRITCSGSVGHAGRALFVVTSEAYFLKEVLVDNFHKEGSIVDGCPVCGLLKVEVLCSLVSGEVDAAAFYGDESALLRELGFAMAYLSVRQMREHFNMGIDEDWLGQQPVTAELLREDGARLLNKTDAAYALVFLELADVYSLGEVTEGLQGSIQGTLTRAGGEKSLLLYQIVVLCHALVKANEQLMWLYEGRDMFVGVKEHLHRMAVETATSARIDIYVSNLWESGDAVYDMHRQFMKENGTAVRELADTSTHELPDDLVGVRWEALTYPPDSGRRGSVARAAHSHR